MISNHRCAWCGLALLEPVYFETVPTDERAENGFGIPIPFSHKEVTLPFCSEACAKAYVDDYEVVEA